MSSASTKPPGEDTPAGKNFSISLHCPPAPGTNYPSLSGYCQKLETFFRLVSFEGYTLVPSTFQSSPTGKLPYITFDSVPSQSDDGQIPADSSGAQVSKEIITDSHFIIQALITRNLIPDPDTKLQLTPQQKSDSRAQCVWVEQHIYPCIVHQRWSRTHNYNVNKSLLPAPWFIKPLLGWYLRRNITAAMWAIGVARYADEQVDGFVLEWLDNLEERFGGGDEGKEKWMLGVGVGPGLVDATVWGFLINILGIGEGNQEAVKGIRERKGVCDFVRRGGRRWFPEYDVEGMLSGSNTAATPRGREQMDE